MIDRHLEMRKTPTLICSMLTFLLHGIKYPKLEVLFLADVAKHWLPCNERRNPPGDYSTEEYLWCEDLSHGLGLWLYEYPIINRMFSLDYPTTFKKGMTMAVEPMEFDPEVGRTKMEEMIIVGDKSAEIMTKVPVKDMMIAHPILTA